MDNIANSKGTTYADRPSTALVEVTGFISTPVSEPPIDGSTARPTDPMPYHCQSAISFSRPELTAVRLNSSNYARAYAESHEQSPTVEDPGSSPHALGRWHSFSVEDYKRMVYHHLMEDGQEAESGDGEGAKKKSPGIGNSELKGREFAFTSTG